MLKELQSLVLILCGFHFTLQITISSIINIIFFSIDCINDGHVVNDAADGLLESTMENLENMPASEMLILKYDPIGRTYMLMNLRHDMKCVPLSVLGLF